LSPADIMFLTVLTEVYQPVNHSKQDQEDSGSKEENDQENPATTDASKPLISADTKLGPNTPLSGSNLAMLIGSPSGFNPHVVHVAPISEKVALVLVLEVRVADLICD
jgi:hypothetical protein